MNKFKSIITSDPERDFNRILYYIVALVLFIVFFWLNHIDFNISRIFDFDKKIVEVVIGVLIAISSSVLASIIFIYIFNVNEKSAIQELKKIAPSNFFVSLISDLGHYEGIIKRNHFVRIILSESSIDNRIYNCTFIYDYQTKINKKNLLFKIVRLRKNDDFEKHPPISDDCLTNEFVWHNGEYDFPMEVDSSYYSLDFVEIGSKKYTPKLVFSEKDEDVLTYKVFVEEDLDKDVFYNISFAARVPFEKESMMSITSEFITENSGIEFDYKGVSNKIDVCVMGHAGIKENSIYNDIDGNFNIRRRVNGWVLPRNGWVIAWWKK